MGDIWEDLGVGNEMGADWTVSGVEWAHTKIDRVEKGDSELTGGEA